MGRYKAGDRVKILAGHPYFGTGGTIGEEMEGTVLNVGRKAAGYRGKYLVDVGGSVDLAFKGRELELLPAIADAPAEWEPKVGDRVRVVSARLPIKEESIGVEFVIDKEEYLIDGKPSFGGKGAHGFVWTASELGLVSTPATIEAGKTYRDTEGKSVGPMIAYLDGFIEVVGDGRMWNRDGSAENEHPSLVLPPLTIEAGRSYVTRDGRKVGPMVRGTSSDPAFYWTAPETGDAFGSAWHQDGAFHQKGSPYWSERSFARDLVAEWVEPVATTVQPAPAVVEPAATVEVTTERKFGFAVGDKIKPKAGDADRVNSHYDSCFAATYGASDGTYFIREFTDWEIGISAKNEGGAACFFFATRFEPAASPAKVKVGDRVWDVRANGDKCNESTVSAVRADGWFTVNWDDGEVGTHWWSPSSWEHRESVAPVAAVAAGPVGVTIVQCGAYKARGGEIWTNPEPIEPAGNGYAWKLSDENGVQFKFMPNGRFFDWGESGCDLVEVVSVPTPPTPTPTHFIVARLTSTGQPRANVRPRVHATLDDANNEAQRLADRLGDEFAVYQRVSSRTVDAGPVPVSFRGNFDAALAKAWIDNGNGEYAAAGEKPGMAFQWSKTPQGFTFWSAQCDQLTHLGRAILKKWIAEAATTTKEAA